MPSKEILFQPFPKQDEFITACLSGKFDFVLFGGAIRGGKTYALIALFTFLSRVFPGSRWAIVRKDLPVIKRNTYPTWEKIKPTNFIEKHDKELHEVHFKNGSRLIFFPENYAQDKELNRWKGLEVNGIGFEEINECQQKSLYKAFERSGTYVIKGLEVQPPSIIAATCNPSRGWVYDLVYKPYIEGRLNSRWKYIQSRIYDNIPLLEAHPGLIDQYKNNMPRYEYEVFVEGNWDVQLKTGGEAYKSFELNVHVGMTNYNPKLPLHISFDENVNPYLPAGIFQIDGTDIYWIGEIAARNPENTIRSVCDVICREYVDHVAGMFIYGDATSKKQDTKLEKGQNYFTLIMQYLSMFRPTLRVPQSNPSVAMRLKWINDWMETGRDEMTLTIDESCKTAISDLVAIKEAPDGTKHKEKEKDSSTGVTHEKYGHFSDLFDYFVCEAFKEQYIAYQRGGIEGRTISGRRRQSKNKY